MNDKDSSIAALLDEATAERVATRDGWDAILREARREDRRRHWLAAGIPAGAVLAAAILGLALAWPFHDGTKGSVLDRALAAVGDGPVLHVVFRQGWGGTLVDLQSGRRTTMHGEKEAWYDPRQGLHEAMRFGGVLEYDVLYPADKVPASLVKTYAGLGTGYVAALRAGDAAVAGEGEVDGIPVYWIKVHRELLPDVADNRMHEFAQEIAISRETYKPVATRAARDGNGGPDGPDRILDLERLPAEQGNFTRMAPDLNGMAMRFGRTATLEPGQVADVLGRQALWAGKSVADVPLARISRTEYASGYDRQTRRWAESGSGVAFSYGSVDQAGASTEVPSVEVAEATKRYRGFQRGVVNYVPPPGSLLLIGSHLAAMQKDGLQVSIEGSSEELILAVARALEPMPSVGSGARR